jgi:hypothetical protein
MKSALRSLVLFVCILSFTTTDSSATPDASPSATGAGAVSLRGDLKRRFELEAVAREDGSVSGRITIIDPSEIPQQDVDGTEEPGLEGSASGLEVTVEVDSMKVKDNRAVLSGIVTSTNLPRYAGLRVILTVEDNDEGGQSRRRDKITWGFYQRASERLVSDADNPESGIYLMADREFDSNSFPLSSYTLSAIDEGDIQIRPGKSERDLPAAGRD